MTILISLLLFSSLLSHLCFCASVSVGVVNGTEAKPHSRPYMVSVQLNGHHKCGGFLISDQFVLTAAHCRKDSETILTVVAGAHNLLSKKEKTVRTSVSSYETHSSYKPVPNMAKAGDIMILKLDKKIKTSKTINWIPIPSTPVEIKADTECSVAGWGYTTSEGSPSPSLREANVKIRNNNECAVIWAREYIASEMMCVYGDGGTCRGDSGGPLVCAGTAVGITSFSSEKCNDPKAPEVSVQISAFLPWIQNITKSAH